MAWSGLALAFGLRGSDRDTLRSDVHEKIMAIHINKVFQW